MLDFCKKHFYKLLLSLVYTTLACLVYGIWSYSAWHLWYVTFIIVILFVIAGCGIGFLWLREDLKSKEAPVEEIKQEESIEVLEKNEE